MNSFRADYDVILSVTELTRSNSIFIIMMSIHEASVSRLNSRGSISASRTKLCHICGDEYPKSALPKHQKRSFKLNLVAFVDIYLPNGGTEYRVQPGHFTFNLAQHVCRILI
jgi:hypothetical protein